MRKKTNNKRVLGCMMLAATMAVGQVDLVALAAENVSVAVEQTGEVASEEIEAVEVAEEVVEVAEDAAEEAVEAEEVAEAVEAEEVAEDAAEEAVEAEEVAEDAAEEAVEAEEVAEDAAEEAVEAEEIAEDAAEDAVEAEEIAEDAADVEVFGEDTLVIDDTAEIEVVGATMEVTVNNFKIKITDGVAVMAGYVGTATKITLPEKVSYSGSTYKMTTIAERAFYNNQTIQTVIIPSSYNRIGNAAFAFCANLKSVTINGDLADIGSYAVDGYGNRSESTAPFYQTGTNATDFVVTFGEDVNRVPAYLFATKANNAGDTCAHITKVVLSSGVTEIANSAFANCYFLKTITFNDNLQTIEKYAFSNCRSLQKLSFPRSLQSIGNYAFENNSKLTEVVVPERCGLKIFEGAFSNAIALKTLTLGGTLEIGAYAFQNANSLVNLTIPEKLTRIGGGAFRYSSNLANIVINSNLADIGGYAADGYGSRSESAAPFYQTGSNTDAMVVTFGENVTRIPNYLFATKANDGRDTCAHITKVVLSNSVTEIAHSAFVNCYCLAEVQFGTGLQIIGEYAFQNDQDLKKISLPASLQEVRKSAFENCSKLATVTIAEKSNCKILNDVFKNDKKLINLNLGGTLEVGNYAFENCTGLEKLIIPNKTTRIGNGAFRYCSKLTNVTINSDLADIGHYAADGYGSRSEDTAPFYRTGTNTDSMTVTFGPEVTRIPSYLFATKPNDAGDTCAHVTKVFMPDSLNEIGYYAFGNCVYLSDVTWGKNIKKIDGCAFYNNNALKAITLPEGLQSIGNSCFENCVTVKSVAFPKSLISIGKQAFMGCLKLRDLSMNNTLTIIPYKAFSNCSSLEKVKLPRTVQEIGEWAFSDCVKLSRITIPTAATNIHNNLFTYPKNMTICSTVTSTAKKYAENRGIAFIEVVQVEEKFTDVTEKDWFLDYVQYAYDEGLMSGKSATTFGPNVSINRAEFATVLYNYEKRPNVEYAKTFKDVAQGTWYSAPVLWAYNKKIVSGYPDGRYGVFDPITREQMAIMLYKYSQMNGYDTTFKSTAINSFGDKGKVSSWAVDAMNWAVSKNIISGKGANLDPTGKATRGECATMMMKLLEGVAKK